MHSKNRFLQQKEIINPSRMYAYSKFVNIVLGILFILVGIFVFGIMEIIFYNYINRFDATLLKSVVLHICAGACAVPFIVYMVNIFLKVYKINKIITHGKCYNGKIISFSMYGVYQGTEISRNHKKNIILNIEYKRNKTHYCKASGYIRTPERVLGNRECKVYIYNNMYFVTGFTIRKKNESKIAIPRER